MRRRPALGLLVAVALAIAVGATAHAQPQAPVSATVVMSADRTRMEAGEIFRLTVEAQVTGASNVNIVLPDLAPFDVLSRQVSTPFSLRFGFGSAQQVQSTTRHVLTLRARQVGRVSLHPAYVEIGGRRFESGALTLDVGGTPGDAVDPSLTDPGTSDLPPAQSVDGMQFDPNGFLRTWVDDGQPYVGQQVTVTIYLYLPGSLRGSPQITQEATTEGFWVQDLLAPSRQLTPQRQEMNGRSFEVYLLRRFAAFPLSEGELTIGAPALSIDQSGGIFGIFGGQAQPAFVRTGLPLTIRARALPTEGRPPGEPHVGSLALAAEIDRAQVITGDAVTLTLTATGRGALQQLRLADPAADGLRVLAPDVRDAISTPNDVVGGTRTIRWLIVPERPGSYTLGPFTVPVLDPRTGTWSVAQADAMTLVAAGNAVASSDDAAEERPPTEASDQVTFGPIHTESALARTHVSLSSQPWFLSLLGIGPLAFLIGLGVRTVRRRAARDDPSKAPKRAQKAAQRRLADAKEHAQKDEPRPFYAAIAKALKDVLEAKLGRAVGSLTHAELARMLGRRGMDDALAAQIVDELEGCDFARFSAVGVSAEEMESCLGRARGILERLDRFTPTPEERP